MPLVTFSAGFMARLERMLDGLLSSWVDLRCEQLDHKWSAWEVCPSPTKELRSCELCRAQETRVVGREADQQG